ncbi:hypothetical protein KBA41_13150, partial [Candidatus Ozemobacteraceae bacterium]|nr:hypothetical protein [Candidatus Ozemobacteraceae bacterium]
MKNGTIWLMLGALLFFCASGAPTAHAASASNNGMTYIMLPSTNSDPAYIVRLEHKDPSGVTTPQAQLYAPGSSGYPAGQYFGLAVSQERDIYLLRSPILGENEGWSQAPVGFLPNASDYATDSDIFLRMIAGGECGTWITVHNTQYWQSSYPIAGTTYPYALVAGGPSTVRYLDPNGSGSAPQGTPIWSGSEGSPNPSDSSKYILPSHWGGMSYYAYGTSQHPDYPWKALDGREDPAGSGIFRPLVLATEVPRKHGPPGWQTEGTMFSCVVKRVYEKRDRSLTLMRGSDNPFSSLTDQSGAVLSATDIRGNEYFARACGDNCIPGGSGPSVAIDSMLANVKVVTSTLGRRYGFNQKGKMAGPYADGKQAALRVVSAAGESTIDMANTDDTVHSNITNAPYLNARGIKASEIKSFGISSNFESTATRDFIYGSKADLFAMQDSWWGKGGIGYEYYKDTGEVYKLDYTNNTNPSPEYLGVLTGKIDSIGVDGDGFLYIMTTEDDLSDLAVTALAPTVDSIPTIGYVVLPSTTEWYRPVAFTESTSSIIVPDSSKQNNDYRKVVYFQGISKKVSKYPPSAGGGSLATPVTAGQLSGYYADEWTKKIRWNGTAANWEGSWDLENEATRDSEIPGELAVVNIAKLPAVFNEIASGPHICREDRLSFDTTVVENTAVKFKVEGYKPYITDTDGTTRRNLKSLGSFGSVYQNVRINYLPNADGEYNHCEDPGNEASGFPTSLFEADGYPTTIVWYADLVDGDTAASPVIASIAVASASDEPFDGALCDWKFTPPHPGNYAVWAKITYNYFNFAGANRPTDLTSGQRTVPTSKRLLQVVSKKSMQAPPSLISAIDLGPERNYPNAFQNCADWVDLPGGGARYDLPEDEKIGSLTVTFKAQFLRDENYRSNQLASLTTYEGIGVWDYNTYCTNYNNNGETLNFTPLDIHVYNFDATISSYTDITKYNPGW